MAANARDIKTKKEYITYNKGVAVCDNENFKDLIPFIEADAGFLQTIKFTEDLRAEQAQQLLSAFQKNFQERTAQAAKRQKSAEHPHLRRLAINTQGDLTECLRVLTSSDSIFESATIRFTYHPNSAQAAETLRPAAAAEDLKDKKEPMENRQLEIRPIMLQIPNLTKPNFAMLTSALGNKLKLWQLTLEDGTFNILENRPINFQGYFKEDVDYNMYYNFIEDLSLSLKHPKAILNSLRFNRCRFIQQGISPFADSLKNNCSLTELTFSSLDSFDLESINSALQSRNVPLSILRITSGGRLEVALETIKVATLHHKIERLIYNKINLVGTKPGSEINLLEETFTPHTFNISKEFKTNSMVPLIELDLSNNQISNPDFTSAVFNFVKCHPFIRTLKYNNCLTTPLGAVLEARCIADCLKTNRSLTSLSLQDNHFEDYAITTILKALLPENNVNAVTETPKPVLQTLLEEIDLRKNIIGEKGLRIISQLLSLKGNLKKLHIRESWDIIDISTLITHFQFIENVLANNTTLIEFSPAVIDRPNLRYHREKWLKKRLQEIQHLCQRNKDISTTLAREAALRSLFVLSRNTYSKIKKHPENFSGPIYRSLWTKTTKPLPNRQFSTVFNSALTQIFEFADIPVEFSSEKTQEMRVLSSSLNLWSRFIRENPALVTLNCQASIYLLANSVYPILKEFIKNYGVNENGVAYSFENGLMSRKITDISIGIKFDMLYGITYIFEESLLRFALVMPSTVFYFIFSENVNNILASQTANTILEGQGFIFSALSNLAYGANEMTGAKTLFGAFNNRFFVVQDALAAVAATSYTLWKVALSYKKSPAQENTQLFLILDTSFNGLRHSSYLFAITNTGFISIPGGVFLAVLERMHPRKKEFIHTATSSLMSAKMLMAFAVTLRNGLTSDDTPFYKNLDYFNTLVLALPCLFMASMIYNTHRANIQYYGIRPVRNLLAQIRNIPNNALLWYQQRQQPTRPLPELQPLLEQNRLEQNKDTSSMNAGVTFAYNNLRQRDVDHKSTEATISLIDTKSSEEDLLTDVKIDAHTINQNAANPNRPQRRGCSSIPCAIL